MQRYCCLVGNAAGSAACWMTLVMLVVAVAVGCCDSSLPYLGATVYILHDKAVARGIHQCTVIEEGKVGTDSI